LTATLLLKWEEIANDEDDDADDQKEDDEHGMKYKHNG